MAPVPKALIACPFPVVRAQCAVPEQTAVTVDVIQVLREATAALEIIQTAVAVVQSALPLKSDTRHQRVLPVEAAVQVANLAMEYAAHVAKPVTMGAADARPDNDAAQAAVNQEKHAIPQPIHVHAQAAVSVARTAVPLVTSA